MEQKPQQLIINYVIIGMLLTFFASSLSLTVYKITEFTLLTWNCPFTFCYFLSEFISMLSFVFIFIAFAFFCTQI